MASASNRMAVFPSSFRVPPRRRVRFEYPKTHGVRFTHEGKIYQCYIEEEKPPTPKS